MVLRGLLLLGIFCVLSCWYYCFMTRETMMVHVNYVCNLLVEAGIGFAWDERDRSVVYIESSKYLCRMELFFYFRDLEEIRFRVIKTENVIGGSRVSLDLYLFYDDLGSPGP